MKGQPDWFADEIDLNGQPGRVVSVDEGKGYQEICFGIDEHLHQMLGSGSPDRDRRKCSKVASQAAMYMVSH